MYGRSFEENKHLHLRKVRTKLVMETKRSGTICFLVLSIIFCSIYPILQVECQMIPISEVRTHPPEEIKRKVTNEEQDGKTKYKTEVHAKIASSHIQEEDRNNDNNPEDEMFTDGDDLSRHAKIFSKDKPPEFQNPEKHASESWLLHFLLERYIQNSLSENENIVAEQVDILQNLEHFSHKYENGRDLFASTNALSDILLPALNSSHIEIRMGSCSVFAVAAQNNLVVQSKSYQVGVIRRLVHLLTSDTALVRSKALYALSSLIRNFPVAQQKFIQDGGVAALIKVATLPETQKRSLTLVTDLLNERSECNDGAFFPRKKSKSGHSIEEDFVEVSEDPCDKAGLLVSSLRAGGWCNILEDCIKNLPGFGDDEQILIVDAVRPSLDICAEQITDLSNYFQQLLFKFEMDEDFGEIVVKPLREILSRLDAARLSSSHTEL